MWLTRFNLLSLIGILIINCFCEAVTLEDEIKADYWRSMGQKTLDNALKNNRIEKAAKNVIFFLGDGMGVSTVTAIRIYKGQKNGKRGEEEVLSFEKFPFVSLSKTYALDRQNPDSANTATAFFCGVKANYGTLGVDGRVGKTDCGASLDNSTHLMSILHKAQLSGKRTGIVTSTRVTHATPGALYAHTSEREWEAYSKDTRCEDIASQLITKSPGNEINVILGGGASGFIPETMNDSNRTPGKRKDGRNLIEKWIAQKKQKEVRASVVFDRAAFKEIDACKVDYLLGLFNTSHMPFIVDRDRASAESPNLVEMTEKAIRILKRGPKGYFLLVEGGRIDSGHHLNSAIRALEEGVEFDAAIEKALELTDREDTLIVVTADHSHPLTISGDYQKRGSNILGLGGTSDVDNMTMSILTYANGPGHKYTRKNLTQDEAVSKENLQDTTYPMLHETHAAEDVAVYAFGPMAHLFHGVHEQSYIPHAISYAACLGLHSSKECAPTSLAAEVKPPLIMLIVLLIFNVAS